MKPRKEIKRILKSLQGITIDKSYYRFVGIEYINDLLSSVGSLNGGRYNLKDAFEVLYMAPDTKTAITETAKSYNFRLPLKIIITIDVNVQTILDFKDKSNIKKLEIDTERLLEPWRYPGKKESYTQTLGRLIYESGRFEGIRYPSAKLQSRYNLAIFPDRMKENSKIKIYDPDKIIEQIIEGKWNTQKNGTQKKNYPG